MTDQDKEQRIEESLAKQLQRSMQLNAKLCEKIRKLEASCLAWEIIAKQNAKLAKLTPTEQTKALSAALDKTMNDLIRCADEIQRLDPNSTFNWIS